MHTALIDKKTLRNSQYWIAAWSASADYCLGFLKRLIRCFLAPIFLVSSACALTDNQRDFLCQAHIFAPVAALLRDSKADVLVDSERLQRMLSLFCQITQLPMVLEGMDDDLDLDDLFYPLEHHLLDPDHALLSALKRLHNINKVLVIQVLEHLFSQYPRHTQLTNILLEDQSLWDCWMQRLSSGERQSLTKDTQNTVASYVNVWEYLEHAQPMSFADRLFNSPSRLDDDWRIFLSILDVFFQQEFFADGDVSRFDSHHDVWKALRRCDQLWDARGVFLRRDFVPQVVDRDACSGVFFEEWLQIYARHLSVIPVDDWNEWLHMRYAASCTLQDLSALGVSVADDQRQACWDQHLQKVRKASGGREKVIQQLNAYVPDALRCIPQYKVFESFLQWSELCTCAYDASQRLNDPNVLLWAQGKMIVQLVDNLEEACGGDPSGNVSCAHVSAQRIWPFLGAVMALDLTFDWEKKDKKKDVLTLYDFLEFGLLDGIHNIPCRDFILSARWTRARYQDSSLFLALGALEELSLSRIGFSDDESIDEYEAQNIFAGAKALFVHQFCENDALTLQIMLNLFCQLTQKASEYQGYDPSHHVVSAMQRYYKADQHRWLATFADVWCRFPSHAILRYLYKKVMGKKHVPDTLRQSVSKPLVPCYDLGENAAVLKKRIWIQRLFPEGVVPHESSVLRGLIKQLVTKESCNTVKYDGCIQMFVNRLKDAQQVKGQGASGLTNRALSILLQESPEDFYIWRHHFVLNHWHFDEEQALTFSNNVAYTLMDVGRAAERVLGLVGKNINARTVEEYWAFKNTPPINLDACIKDIPQEYRGIPDYIVYAQWVRHFARLMQYKAISEQCSNPLILQRMHALLVCDLYQSCLRMASHAMPCIDCAKCPIYNDVLNAFAIMRALIHEHDAREPLEGYVRRWRHHVWGQAPARILDGFLISPPVLDLIQLDWAYRSHGLYNRR